MVRSASGFRAWEVDEELFREIVMDVRFRSLNEEEMLSHKCFGETVDDFMNVSIAYYSPYVAFIKTPGETAVFDPMNLERPKWLVESDPMYEDYYIWFKDEYVEKFGVSGFWGDE